MIGRRSSSTTEPEPAPEAQPRSGKGRPTPSRKEAQAKNRRPLVAADRGEARRIARQRRQEAWARQQQAMRTGDERYLPLRDKGPVRRYARDYVDARWSFGELFLPLALLMLVTMMLIGQIPQVATVLVLVVYGVMLLAILDGVFLAWRLKRKLAAKFGAENIPAWTGFYAASRSFYLRRLRQPRPQVKRGEYPA